MSFAPALLIFVLIHNMNPDALEVNLYMPHFMTFKYEFRALHEILELEFTKMLEQDIRFRKCKRCGRYFIMKDNGDTNYCDRVAEGQTRSCQALAKSDECSDGKITIEEYIAWMEGCFPNRTPKT